MKVGQMLVQAAQQQLRLAGGLPGHSVTTAAAACTAPVLLVIDGVVEQRGAIVDRLGLQATAAAAALGASTGSNGGGSTSWRGGRW